VANIVDILLQIRDEASGPLEDFRERLREMGAAGEAVADNLGKLTVGAAVAGLNALSDKAIESTKALSEEANVIREMQTVTGFSAKTIQTMTFAAEKLGIDTGEATDFLRDFNFEVGDAANGAVDVQKKWKDLGVSITDEKGNLKDNEQILNEVADALSEIDNLSQRAALAATLFGESAQKLLPILEGGSEGLSNYARELENMGAVIDDISLKKLKKFDDTMAEIEASSKRLAIEMIDTAQAGANIGQVWDEGINQWSRTLLRLLPLQDEESKKLAEQAEHKKNLAAVTAEVAAMYEEKEAPAIMKTASALEEEKKALEKVIALQLKQSKALEKQAAARDKVNASVQDQIDLLKAERTASKTEAAGLKRGVAERKIERDIEALRGKGADDKQLEELRRLKIENLDKKEVKESTDEVKESTDAVKESTDAVKESVDDLRETSKETTKAVEETTKRIGGLADAFTGGDRASGGTNERLIFRPSFQGMANDAEDLNRQFDRARAASVAEILREAQAGIIDISDTEFNRFLEEFRGLEKRTQGEFGSVKEFEEKQDINIQFNPNQDFDNMSTNSQRQLAELIAGAMMSGSR